MCCVTLAVFYCCVLQVGMLVLCYSSSVCCCVLQIGMLEGINRTVEYFRNELKRRRHDERNVFLPEI